MGRKESNQTNKQTSNRSYDAATADVVFELHAHFEHHFLGIYNGTHPRHRAVISDIGTHVHLRSTLVFIIEMDTANLYYEHI